MINLFNFLKLNKERLAETRKNTSREIRKIESKKQEIIYNTNKDWLKVQNFNSQGIEVIYYLNISDENNMPLSVKRFTIKNMDSKISS